MRCGLVVAAVLLCSVPSRGQLCECSAVSGWQQKGNARSFEPDNLFDYIDGNAEGYLLYRFAGMKGITCTSGEVTFVIDISEMASPEYAYGIFCANRNPREPVEKIGMGGQVLPRKATFAKDRFYVEISANPEGDHAAALRQFVREIEGRIEGQIDLPKPLSWFPEAGLVKGSVRLVPESVLGIRLLSRGYVGQYDFGRAFIVQTDGPAAAVQLMTKLRERFRQTSEAPVADGGFSATDRYLDGVCVFRKGSYVAGFANLKSRNGLREAGALASRIP